MYLSVCLSAFLNRDIFLNWLSDKGTGLELRVNTRDVFRLSEVKYSGSTFSYVEGIEENIELSILEDFFLFFFFKSSILKVL